MTKPRVPRKGMRRALGTRPGPLDSVSTARAQLVDVQEPTEPGAGRSGFGRSQAWS